CQSTFVDAASLSSRSLRLARRSRSSEIRPHGVNAAETDHQIPGRNARREPLADQSPILGIAGKDAERRITPSRITRSVVGGGVAVSHCYSLRLRIFGELPEQRFPLFRIAAGSCCPEL